MPGPEHPLMTTKNVRMPRRDTEDSSSSNNISNMTELQFSASLDALIEDTTSRLPPSYENDTQMDDAAFPIPDKAYGGQYQQMYTNSTGTIHAGASLFGKKIEFSKPEPVASKSVTTSSDSLSRKQKSKSSKAKKRKHDNRPAISEDESELERRRQERNQREQQRSQHITDQIEHLKILLQDAQVEFKNDKYNTLAAVVKYVRQLQERTILLETEHKKLLSTISRTSDIVANTHTNSKDAASAVSNDLFMDRSESPPQDESMIFVQGIDYETVFNACPTAFAIAGLDGRLRACNKCFDEIVAFPPDAFVRSETESDETASAITTSTEGSSLVRRNLSLFDIVYKEEMNAVFACMSTMLKRGSEKGIENEALPEDRWNQTVSVGKNRVLVDLHIGLVRTKKGEPRFFTCTMLNR